MTNQPDAAKLLAIARATLLDNLLPHLPDNLRYDALMVANAMAISIREYAAGDTAAQGELARIAGLFAENSQPLAGEALATALTDCNRRLAAEIRNGRFYGKQRAALLNHLEKTSVDALAISNPRLLKP